MKTRTLFLVTLLAAAFALPAFADEAAPLQPNMQQIIEQLMKDHPELQNALPDAAADEEKPDMASYLKTAEALPVVQTGSCDKGMTKVSLKNNNNGFSLMTTIIGNDTFYEVRDKDSSSFAVLRGGVVQTFADGAAYIDALKPNAPELVKSLLADSLKGTDCTSNSAISN